MTTNTQTKEVPIKGSKVIGRLPYQKIDLRFYDVQNVKSFWHIKN